MIDDHRKEDSEPSPTILIDNSHTDWDEKIASQMAEVLAKREETLATLLENTPTNFDGKPIGQKKVFIEHYDSHQRVSSYEEAIAAMGIGSGGVVFYESKGDSPREWVKDLGINTPFRLDVGLHTHEPTRAKLEELAKTDPKAKNLPFTVYFAGQDSDERYVFRKVHAIPNLIPMSGRVLSRTSLQTFIEGEMRVDDVEIMGAALEALTTRLQTPKQST